ncbi:MAG TPA: hypothetical protein VFA58_02710, partial [Chthoniobacterales bacterium]|nr:hypothetical protein [Chthoniobacterales bacterium]
MKKFFVLFSLCAVTAFISCEKQSEADKKAEIERQVQERLAAERQAQQQQELDQRQSELDAREKALQAQQNAASETTPSERAESETLESRRGRSAEPRERSISVGYSTFYNKLDP